MRTFAADGRNKQSQIHYHRLDKRNRKDEIVCQKLAGELAKRAQAKSTNGDLKSKHQRRWRRSDRTRGGG